MRKAWVVLFGMVLACSVTAVPVKADSIDFSGLAGGNVSFTPSPGNSLSVTNAPLSTLFVTSNPNTFYPVTFGNLSFTTGTANSVQSGTLSCLIGTCASFNGGGSLSITGGVSGLPNGTSIPNGTTLVSGTPVNGSGFFFGSFGSFSGAFDILSINPTLLTALGFRLPVATELGQIGQVFFNLSYSNGSLTGNIGSTNALIGIPEPGGLFLLGGGLLAMGLLLRWRVKRIAHSA